MTVRDLKRACIDRTATVRDALAVINDSPRFAIVTDEAGRLLGLLTDGDLRRAILAGAGLDHPAAEFATPEPIVVAAGSPRPLVLDLMRSLHIDVVPELDADGVVTGLHTLSDIVGAQELPNVAVIMAGGKGTRLGDLTKTTPKPLMTVAGRSILEWIVLNLVGEGIREIYVSVNHLADQIIDHLGDGSRLGCTVHYLREEPDKPLGTAGSLTLLRAQRPELRDPVLVMNGDLMVQFSAANLLAHHGWRGAAITMGVRPYQHEIPFGVVESASDGRVTGIQEKPTVTVDINTAVYAVSPALLDRLPAGEPSTMPWLVEQALSRDETVIAWRINDDWIDVGTPQDLARAKGIG